MDFCSFFEYEKGIITLKSDGEAITALGFGANGEPSAIVPDVHRIAETELSEYFSGCRKAFSVPIKLSGTAFQLSVWDALLQIPYGETRSYADVAAMIGNPKACRAVGNANHKNPVAIIVPCHRVIASGGGIGGYGGGLEIKRYLLNLESSGKICVDKIAEWC